ncbi:MAG: apolipoprotein N-acyltransferase, partial [Pseudopedobacter sp.]|nr:apolipoprotein N-acyltransferase [Deinococcales bacterium]
QAGADVLVNVSNDGWYGVGSGIDQHFQMGRLRAIETRRYILRAGNVGITAILDQRGNVTAEIPRFTQGTLRGSFKRLEGQTPYVILGDWPLGVALLLIVWGLAKPRRYEFRL